MAKKSFIMISAAVALSLMILTPLYGATGLDTGSFNQPNGYTLYNSKNIDFSRAVAVQPDGRILAAGATFNGLTYDVLVVRFNADGSLDTTFGTRGVFTYDRGTDDYGYAMALRSDGKIIIAGCTYNGTTYDILVLRLNGNGTLDTSFGSRGVVTYDGGSNDFAYAAALQPDGKILVVGENHNGMDHDALVLRFNGNGSLDTSFGSGGVVTYDSGYNDYANALSLQSDGRIVVAGIRFNGIDNDVLVLRFNGNGTPDTSFGSRGVVIYDSGRDDVGHGVVAQKDGKIVVAGSTFNGMDNDVLVLRFSRDGSLDSSFGKGGVAVYDSGCDDNGLAVALESDGRIIVALGCFNSMGYSGMVLRFNGNGSLDGAFGEGCVLREIIEGNAFVTSLALQQDGKILVAGARFNGSVTDMLVVRILPGLSSPASGKTATFSLSGNVMLAAPAGGRRVPAAGVTVTLSGAVSGSAVTDASGNYTFTGLSAGNYVLTPDKAGLVFTPNQRLVTISSTDISGQNFMASAPPANFSLSGAVTTENGAPMAHVTITITGTGSGTATTDSKGRYTFGGLAGGAYTVTAFMSGVAFAPPSITVAIAGADVTGLNFSKNR